MKNDDSDLYCGASQLDDICFKCVDLTLITFSLLRQIVNEFCRKTANSRLKNLYNTEWIYRYNIL
jgi:hypothetical protein